LRVARFYVIFGKVLYPIAVVVEALMKLFQKKHVQTQITDEDIESFIDMGHESGAFEK